MSFANSSSDIQLIVLTTFHTSTISISYLPVVNFSNANLSSTICHRAALSFTFSKASTGIQVFSLKAVCTLSIYSLSTFSQ
jgi:hypothetical protein